MSKQVQNDNKTSLHEIKRSVLEYAVPFLKAAPFLPDETSDPNIQQVIDALFSGKLGWDEFLSSPLDLNTISRICHLQTGRTLLHQAVLDHQLDCVRRLKSEASLKYKKDGYGLTPIDLALLLHRKEVLEILEVKLARREFSGFTDLEYLASLTFESRETLEKVLQIVFKAKKEDEIPSEKIWMGVYYEKEIRKSLPPPFSIRHIDNEVGFGVFAERKIPACAFVGEYTGVVEQKKSTHLKGKRHCLRYTVWESRKNYVINAEKKGNFTRFLNHSDKPNLILHSVYCGGLPRMIFVTVKEIEINEQLTFDYGASYWKELGLHPKPFV